MNAFHDLVVLERRGVLGAAGIGPGVARRHRVGGRIDVLPVNHTVVDGHVAWLSGTGTKLGAAAAEQPVALEADDIDESGRRAGRWWSTARRGS